MSLLNNSFVVELMSLKLQSQRSYLLGDAIPSLLLMTLFLPQVEPKRKLFNTLSLSRFMDVE